MRKIFKKGLGCILSAIALAACIAVPAFAEYSYGPSTTFSANGVTYIAHPEIGSGDGSMINGYGMVNASRTVQTGWMGANIRIYINTGTLFAQNTAYNNIDMQYFIAYTSSPPGSFYRFYASGTAYGWAGTSYVGKSMSNTGPVSRSAESFVVKSYPVNESGMTYGSGLSAEYVGEEPDLISAIGKNGIDGYVKNTDINMPIPSNPEEAVSLYGTSNIKTVPVYDVDGTTIVDWFDTEIGVGLEGTPNTSVS